MRRPSIRMVVAGVAILFALALGLAPRNAPVQVIRVLAATGSATFAAPSLQVGTTSSSTATITLNEGAAADYPAASTVTVVVSIYDGAGNDRLGFAGTPTLSAPGSIAGRTATLGAAALDNQLTISWTGSDIASLEPIVVTGLRISAASNAVAGTIRAYYATSGIAAAYYGAGSWTAAGSLTNTEAVGATTLEVTADSGTFPFAVSGFGNGLLSVAAPNAESVGVSGVGAGPILTTNPLGFIHSAGTRVTQTVAVAGTLTTVPIAAPAGILTQTTSGATTVVAGLSDQSAGVTRLIETISGTIPAGAVITYTLSAAGVQFATAPTADPDDRLAVASLGTGAPGPCALNQGRTSCAVILTGASNGAPGTIDLTGIRLDVAGSVPTGTVVVVAVSVSPAVVVSVSSRTVATVGSSSAASLLTALGTTTGATTSGPFAVATTVVPVGRYVTWRFTIAPAIPNARIELWMATSTGSGWSTFTRITSRLTDASGSAYYWARSSMAKRVSVRAYFAGDAGHLPAWSPARQARWR